VTKAEEGGTTEHDGFASTRLAATEDVPVQTHTVPLAAPATIRERRSVGRFRIDQPLGSGGMADVFRAYDPMLDRAVALKLLRNKRADDPQRMRRMLREARAAAALTHPNTVTIFDVGEDGGEVFIAMELLEGEVLRAVIARGTASLSEKRAWLLQAARALAAAHERGLVHRDVKPDNMFVCKDGTLKLLDFGIAKRDDDDTHDVDAEPVGPSSLRTVEGRRIGTPRYMAPEQHAGLPTDPRTDEYAWGLVAFELLTGSHPIASFETATSGASGGPSVEKSLRQARFGALRASVPEIADDIGAAIARALEPRMEDRFPSMAPVVAALETSAAAEPAAMAKPAPTPPPEPRSRRARWPYVVGVGALVAVSAGAVRFLPLARAPQATPVASATPACRVEASYELPLDLAKDRAAILPDGTIVVARDIARGLVFEKIVDGKVSAFEEVPIAEQLGKDHGDVLLRGISLQNTPAVFIEMRKNGFQPSVVAALTGGRVAAVTRLGASATGIAIASLGTTYAIMATTVEATRPDELGLKGGMQVHVTDDQEAHRATLEEGSARAPAVALRNDRISLAYEFGDSIHFATLDKTTGLLGDILTVAHVAVPPAVAFAGEEVAVYWIGLAEQKSRLTVATLPTGATAFRAPIVVLDEALALVAPAAASAPDGRSVLAWVASTGGMASVRVAPVGPAGELRGATTLASASNVQNLIASAANDGTNISWVEGRTKFRAVRVTCAAVATSRPGPQAGGR